MNTIVFKSVDFSYRKKDMLLSNVDLRIPAGHIHGLLGKNGEGKSTLLKLTAGLLFPLRGEVETLGLAARERRPELLRDIYFLAEEMPVIRLSIEQWESVYAPFYPKFSREQFNNYLKMFEIPSKGMRLDQASLGQKKKVLIAFGLAANTRILLMDEPTNGLDIPSKGQFRRIVAGAMEDERSILISTHQVRDLDSLIDNLIIMNDHRIVLNETVESIANHLLFRSQAAGDSPSDAEVLYAEVLYAENNLQGFAQVCTNPHHEDSKPDIELLFNAVCARTEAIGALFNTRNEQQ